MSNDRRRELLETFFYEIRASQNAVDAVDQAVADALGLHRTDLRCLDILDRDGPMTAGRLARLAHLSPGAMTALLDRLERAGLAKRRRDTEDRRRVLVEVTPKLRRLAAQVYPPPDEAAQALAHYSDAELQLLNEFLRGSREWNEARLAQLQELVAKKRLKTA
jgi:DNA-binding MarR family transcriptional regulator